MSSSNHNDDNFLFASLGSHQPLTARRVHIRRLYDVLQLCLHRNDLERASRAWSILARCKELHWMTMWTTGMLLVGVKIDEGRRNSKLLDYLRTMMLRHQDNREHILQELILQLIQAGRHREALDELELYLPSFPYRDKPVLHIYAGLASIYLAQPTTTQSTFNANLLRAAQTHFEHAQGIDPSNVVAKGFLDKIRRISEKVQTSRAPDPDSENEDMVLDDSPRRKRVRA